MENLKFTRDDTSIAKGIAIICMFIHHLFTFPNRIKGSSEFISLFQFNGNNIEYWFGQYGRICVAMFLFFSGFGIYKQFTKNNADVSSNVFKRLKNLYVNYWTVFIIFIPISFFTGYREFNLAEFFDNFIGYRSTYDGEWWFFELYVLVIATFPITVKLIKNSSVSSFFKIMVLAVLSRTVYVSLKDVPLFNTFAGTIFYGELNLLLTWLPCFLMGVTFAKFDLFPKISQKFKDNKLDNIFVYLLICLVLMYIRFRNDDVIDFDYLIAPLYILCSVSIVKILKLNKIFIYLGKHSSNMWLVHSFFCYQYFQWWVYLPKISIFVLLWLTIITIATSIAIEFIKKQFTKLCSGEFKLAYMNKALRD
ncbi:acyltransferase family protein [Clostridium saccharobutylicum]|uniref:Acyltransferase family protein n=1 Tax=Clostridium saccharobutylicum TaxID=169679 RepID=A0A1S8NJF9_CLOSA|nr:acyltransferase [Clostridium saccharobutylicum]OOM16558.1 acyltransferase family protein [Clostridium saccharobutylicum]